MCHFLLIRLASFSTSSIRLVLADRPSHERVGRRENTARERALEHYAPFDTHWRRPRFHRTQRYVQDAVGYSKTSFTQFAAFFLSSKT